MIRTDVRYETSHLLPLLNITISQYILNSFSPNIHIQILQTYLHTFPYRIRWENLIKRSKHFPFCDHFITSYNLSSWLCTNTVGRRLMLNTVTFTLHWSWMLTNLKLSCHFNNIMIWRIVSVAVTEHEPHISSKFRWRAILSGLHFPLS